jgi:HlyD family secretion protein/epimerase transport system membrane fusion protein
MSVAAYERSIQQRDRYARPQRPAVVGFAVIAAFVGVLALWGTLAPVSGAAIARGNLQVESKRQSVQHPYGGVVRELLVKEGDQVTKGQVLMSLFDSEPRSRLDVLTIERDALKAREARLIGEREGAREPQLGADLLGRADDPSVAQAVANERAIMAARQRQHATEAEVLRQKVNQLQEQVRGTTAQLTGIERQKDLYEEEADGAKQLHALGYTPKTRILAMERDLAKLEADRGAKRAEIARAREAIAETELEIAKLDRARLTQITDQLRETQSRLVEIEPKIDAARDVVQRTQITAPAAGAVVGLSVFTVGGVIQPGARLMDVVPSKNDLMVEARLPLSDISELTPGRPADVRLVSINHSERPKITGEIQTVSADRLTDERSGESYYLIQVRMNPDDVARSKVDLQAGMVAEVVVTTRPRTFIEYLVSPLTDEITRAFREK